MTSGHDRPVAGFRVARRPQLGRHASGLDTYYVENWSLTSDLVILWKTAKAVVRSPAPTDLVQPTDEAVMRHSSGRRNVWEADACDT